MSCGSIYHLKRERDDYKALAERHLRALQKWRMGGGHLHGAVVDTDKCPACLEFAAAIDAPPDKAQRQAKDAVGYEEAARYDAEQAQQEADHRRDVARDEEIVTEEPGPSRPNR